MDAKQIIERYKKARQIRDKLEPVFDNAIRLTMPGRKRFHDTDPTDSMDDVFDETGANAREEFVSRMQAGLFPPFTRFLKLEASSLVEKNDRVAVNRDLEEIEEYAFEEIWASNFAQESVESLNDMSISTGSLLVEESTGNESRLWHKSVPITDFALEKGPNGQLSGMYREAAVKAEDLELRYRPHAKIPKGSALDRDIKDGRDRPLTVVEYTYRDHNRAGEHYRHVVVVQDHSEIIVDREMSGIGSNPFINFRWSTIGGEAWGRGPLLNAMAAIRTTNLMVELILENAAMSIVGIYQSDNDATVNPDNISLLPGSIISKEVGTRGLEPVNTSTGNFNMQDVVLSDQRLNIRKALYNDMLADPNKTPATATEVAERMADLAYRTSSGFARMFYEFLVPYMRRVLYILEKKGDIELPVKNGRALAFRAVSPLAQAQYGRDVQTLMRDFGVRSQIYGPQVAMATYNMEELEPWLQKRMGLDQRLYNSPREIQRVMQRTMEQMQAEPAPRPEAVTPGG